LYIKLKFIVEQTLQIVLITDIYVLQGSVATRLQYARIFIDLLITHLQRI